MNRMADNEDEDKDQLRHNLMNKSKLTHYSYCILKTKNLVLMNLSIHDCHYRIILIESLLSMYL